jgi:hypothetical protein
MGIFHKSTIAGLALGVLLTTGCGTLTGAAVGAGAGAAVGHGTGYGAGKGALIEPEWVPRQAPSTTSTSTKKHN